MIREVTTGDESRQGAAMSMRASWSTNVVDGGAEERGASAEERCSAAAYAENAMGLGADLS